MKSPPFLEVPTSNYDHFTGTYFPPVLRPGKDQTGTNERQATAINLMAKLRIVKLKRRKKEEAE